MGGRTKGWGEVSLVCPYFEVNFLACITKCHFSINLSLGGLKEPGKFY